MDEGTNDASSMVCKPCDNEASSSEKKPEASDLVSGRTLIHLAIVVCFLLICALHSIEISPGML